MQKRNKFLSFLALFTFLFGVSVTKTQVARSPQKAEAAEFTVTWNVGEQGYTDGEFAGSKVIDDNFEINFYSGRYLLAPRYFSEGSGYISLQGSGDWLGNGFLISPRPTINNYFINKIVITATDAAYTSQMRTQVGQTMRILFSRTNEFFSGATYTFEEPSKFRYFNLENYAGNEIRIKQISLTYTDVPPAAWVNLTSVTKAKDHYDIKRGVHLLIDKPTIEPSNAFYDYFLTTEDTRLRINGPYVVAEDLCENAVVTINTFGRDAGGERLTTTFTVSVTEAPLTIDGAVGMGYGSIDEKLYRFENVRVQDATLDSDNIVLHASATATNKINVMHPGFNPLNTYTYVKGGTMSLFAKVRRNTTTGKNFLVEPEVISYTDKAILFANTIMASDEVGQCVTKYATVRAIINEMTVEELAKLKNAGVVNGINFSPVRARYVAWALHLGESDPYGDGTPISGMPLVPENSNTQNNNVLLVILLSFSVAVFLYFLTSKRKKLYLKK